MSATLKSKSTLAAEVSKKAQRSAILGLLRNELTPNQRRDQSAVLCDRLVERVWDLAHKIPSPHLSLSRPHAPPARQVTVHLCSFLPMYFEPDLTEVFKRLWSGLGAGKSIHGSSDVRIGYRMYAPRMMVPSCVPTSSLQPRPGSAGASPSRRHEAGIMHFVEILDENDLEKTFVEQGKFKIREPTEEVWVSECCREQDANKVLPLAQRRGVLGHADPSPRVFTDCFWPAKRFLPVGATCLPTNEQHHHHMILLCPAAAFDSQCGRIGKGAGYYDRFLQESGKAFACANTNTTFAMTSVGVGFVEQLVAEVAMESHDVFMDEVLTPHDHFVRASVNSKESNRKADS